MPTLRDALLPVFQNARGMMNSLGLRPATVKIISRTWSGGEVRLGNETDAPVTITPPPRVRELPDGGLELDKITPKYAGGGYDPNELVPPDASGVEYLYEVTQADGVPKLYTAARLKIDKNFGYSVTLNPTLYREEP